VPQQQCDVCANLAQFLVCATLPGSQTCAVTCTNHVGAAATLFLNGATGAKPLVTVKEATVPALAVNGLSDSSSPTTWWP